MASVDQAQLCSKSVSMSLSDDGVQRRIGDYHSNLWDDDFIQSLSTPYGAPSYRERAERLVGEVKEMFNSLTVLTPLNDLLQRLWMVDSVERLGIDRHFRNEIKSALDYVYSYWSEKDIGCGRESVVTDLNSTALGFRTLRLHGFPVSSDVLEVFKDQNGKFAGCSANAQTEAEMRGILSLFRASLVAFPGEKVLEEAQIFCTSYLQEALKTVPISNDSLSREIEYVIEYGWLTNFPRLEARNYMDVFGKDTSPCIKTTTMTQKLLELAKLEFNIFHSLQQKELKQLSRWWKDSGFSQLTFTRHRHVEFYTLASCIATEPKHSAFRLGFAKTCYLGIVLDDIYDTFGTMEELELFTAAIKRWDPSARDCLPEYMKGIYMVFYDCVNQMVLEAEKSQGRDTLTYARNTWEAVFDAFLEEAKWMSSGYIPTFEEYLENGKVSFGYRAATLQPILTLDIPLPLHVLQEIDFPSSFNDAASSILRLRGDVCGYQAERSRGEEASSISCYVGILIPTAQRQADVGSQLNQHAAPETARTKPPSCSHHLWQKAVSAGGAPNTFTCRHASHVRAPKNHFPRTVKVVLVAEEWCANCVGSGLQAQISEKLHRLYRLGPMHCGGDTWHRPASNQEFAWCGSFSLVDCRR